jgi:hypothetical protein
MLRVADGDPAATNEVNVTGEAFDLRSLKVERILGNQDEGIGAAFDFDSAANVGEGAVAGADVVAGFFGFEVFVVVVELDVAASKRFRGLFVVLDMVGLEALVAKVDVHVVIGDKEVAAFLLGAAGPDFHVAGFAGMQADLLGTGGGKRRAKEKKKKNREREKEAERGQSPGMRVNVHAEHLCDENSGIA